MIRKFKNLLALTFLSTGLFAQNSESIASFLENQGVALDVYSASKDHNTFAGISNQSNYLFVAQKKIGNYKLPATIDFELTEGAFRPEGFSENEYLFFNVFDASSFVTKNKTYVSNSLNNRYNCLTCNNYPAFVMNPYWDYQLRSIAIFGYLRPQKSYPYYRSNRIQNTQKIGIGVKKLNVKFELFAEAMSLFIFTDNVSSLVELNLDGTILSTKEIKFKAPILSSNKGRGVVKDSKTSDYYIFTETNFSYHWYSLNIETGETKFLLKMDDVWLNPNWTIENGILNYKKVKAGKIKQHELNLNN